MDNNVHNPGILFDVPHDVNFSIDEKTRVLSLMVSLSSQFKPDKKDRKTVQFYDTTDIIKHMIGSCSKVVKFEPVGSEKYTVMVYDTIMNTELLSITGMIDTDKTKAINNLYEVLAEISELLNTFYNDAKKFNGTVFEETVGWD